MKRLMVAIFGFIACASYADVQHVAGGISFDRAVNVDGVDYPAGATIWAESYPTQFVVRAHPASGKQIFYATSDASHGSARVYPMLDGSFMLMPPPTAEDVVSYSFYENGNVKWADANTTVPDAEQDGTEAKPFRVLQRAIAALSDKSFWIVMVKKGVYDEGGEAKGSSVSARRVSIPNKSTGSVIVRAVDGPAETFIVGAPDPNATTPDREGWGDDAVRCVSMGANGCLQGFTLTGGYVATEAATQSGYKTGAGVYCPSGNAMVLDCIISNCYGSAGAVSGVSIVRCRILENHFRTGVVSMGTAVSCEIRDNELVAASGNFTLFFDTTAYNCTIAGNIVRAGNHLLSENLIYNSIIYGSEKSTAATGANNWVWNFSETSKFPVSGFTVANPRFASTDPYDLHLQDASPCLDSVPAPTADNWGATYYQIATADVEGNRLRVAADGKLTAGAFQTGVTEGFPGCLYVDPVNGLDTNDGWKRSRPLKTIQAAMSSPNLASGDIVYLEPGRYDQSNTPAVDSGDDKGLSRVSVPAGVTLASLGNAEDTVIVGAASETVGETSGAVRCVILHDGSTIRGFTLTGGYTDSGFSGAGVVSATPSGTTYAYDCVISNNVSGYRGGGANAVRCVRCFFSGNSAVQQIGLAANGGMLIGCMVDSQAGTGSRTYSTLIRNCTFLPAKSAVEEQDAVNYSNAISVNNCHNSLFLCLTRAEAQYTNCIIATNTVDIIRKGRTYDPAVLGGTVTLIRQEDAFVKKSGVLQARSPAVDAGSNALYDMSWGDVDIRDTRRIVNGTIDIGACEFDPSLLKGLMLICQ